MRVFERFYKNKVLFFSVLIGVLGVPLFLVLLRTFWHTHYIPSQQNNRSFKRVQPTSPAMALDKRKLWKDQIETNEKIRDKRLGYIENVLKSQTKETLAAEIAQLKKELQELKSQPALPPSVGSNARLLNRDAFTGSGDLFSPVNEKGGAPSTTLPIVNGKKVGAHTFNPHPRTSGKKPLASHYMPAGSFLKGVLLSSIDAHTSVAAASDPHPVTIRVLDEGVLPNHFKGRVKRCHLVGAAYGDISSERVMMRLERLSCVDSKTEEVLETTVSGYVAGEDGKAGVRGVVVDKSGPMMARASLGGFLSGVSQFMQTSLANKQLQGVAEKVSSTGSQPVFDMGAIKQGAAQGVGGALDRLSDYYIKRAEQLQPVIAVSAGRRINVVFTKGVWVGDKNAASKRSAGTASPCDKGCIR